MPAPFALFLAGLLAFGPSAVSATFHSITFSSVGQCGPLNISFSGGEAPSALPMTLHVVPINSTELISIVISDADWDDKTQTGAAITFLPLAAGTRFVASLDDANNKSTGGISDIIEVQPSNDSSCLPSSTAVDAPPHFNLPTTVSQCEDFVVSWNTTSPTPSVRAFLPKFFAARLNETGAATPTSASFNMDIARGLSAIFLVDDGHGNFQSTPLLAVDGDTSSPTSCFPTFAPTTGAEATAPKRMSGSAAIAIGAASGGIIGSIAVLMAIYVYRYRLRERQRILFEMEGGGQAPTKEKLAQEEYRAPTPGTMNKEFKFPPSPSSTPNQARRATHRMEPSYSTRTFSYSEDPQTMYDRAEDWNPPPLPSPTQQLAAIAASKQPASASPDALATLDIERALEMATMYNDGDGESTMGRSTADGGSTLRLVQQNSLLLSDLPPSAPSLRPPALIVPRRDRDVFKSGVPEDALTSAPDHSKQT